MSDFVNSDGRRGFELEPPEESPIFEDWADDWLNDEIEEMMPF